MSEQNHVYTGINNIIKKFSEMAIVKKDKNSHQNYKYISISNLMNELSKHLAEEKLCILPQYEAPQYEGKYVVLKGSLTIISAVDGSNYKVTGYNRAPDRDEKAVSSAMSYFYKQLVIQVFCISTEEDAKNDVDRGVSNTITVKQSQHLCNLVAKSDISPEDFLAKHNVKSTLDIKVGDYNKIKEELEAIING